MLLVCKIKNFVSFIYSSVNKLHVSSLQCCVRVAERVYIVYYGISSGQLWGMRWRLELAVKCKCTLLFLLSFFNWKSRRSNEQRLTIAIGNDLEWSLKFISATVKYGFIVCVSQNSVFYRTWQHAVACQIWTCCLLKLIGSFCGRTDGVTLAGRTL